MLVYGQLRGESTAQKNTDILIISNGVLGAATSLAALVGDVKYERWLADYAKTDSYNRRKWIYWETSDSASLRGRVFRGWGGPVSKFNKRAWFAW